MAQKHDLSARIALFDITASLGLLTRLPITLDTERATARGARAAWAYPVAGLVIGLITALIASALLIVGISPLVAAPVIVAVEIIITGAMHEDGIADSADGLWGGWDRTRRLEIMKDSAIGAYGVLALGLAIIIRTLAYGAIFATGTVWTVLIATAVISRAAMVAVMHALPHARETGLSHAVGKPDRRTTLSAMALAALLGLLCLGWTAFPVIFSAVLATAACAAIAKAKIGGQTGDIIGATQQIVTLVTLITLSAANP